MPFSTFNGKQQRTVQEQTNKKKTLLCSISETTSNPVAPRGTVFYRYNSCAFQNIEEDYREQNLP